jgi:uncharacterized membrane protein
MHLTESLRHHHGSLNSWLHSAGTRAAALRDRSRQKQEYLMLKKLIAPVVVSGAFIGSLALGGAAYAATPATAPAAQTTKAGAGHAHQWLKTHRKSLRHEGLAISATTIGITPQALRADLKAGASIATVAAAHGSSAAAVESALTTAVDGAVTRAETAGTLTSAQSSAIQAKVPARIDKLVQHVF